MRTSMCYICDVKYSANNVKFILGKSFSRIHFRDVCSTQLWSDKNVSIDMFENGTDYVLVTADAQTSGIGSHGRKWASKTIGNIYASLSFIKQDTDQYKIYTQISALAVCCALELFIPKKFIKLKWPNDVIVNGKKISGSILHVKTIGNNSICTIGVGINVNLSQNELKEINQPATSLYVETGEYNDSEVILSEYIEYFLSLIAEYRTNHSCISRNFYNKMDYLNEEVAIYDDVSNACFSGIITGIDNHGFLLLNDHGNIKTIMSGTVIKRK